MQSGRSWSAAVAQVETPASEADLLTPGRDLSELNSTTLPPEALTRLGYGP
jgi:hypothetical protein